jgi:predicted phosphodiesterase
MRFAVLSDIHGNLESLEAVHDDAQRQGCSRFSCLGDIVGCGPNPKECLDIIREMNMVCVRGEHDQFVSSDESLDQLPSHVAGALVWTRGQLNSEERQWLGSLNCLNVGSVGQPRDNNPKAAYVIYSLDTAFVELRRVDYDIAATRRKLLAMGLASELAEGLGCGGWGGDEVDSAPGTLEST